MQNWQRSSKKQKRLTSETRSFPRQLTTSVFDYSVSSGMEIVGFNFGRNSADLISLLRGILRNNYIKVKGPSNNVGLSS